MTESNEPQLALLAMQSDGDNLDVQMGMSTGELDMTTAHGYMLNWLGANWSELARLAMISRTKYMELKNDATSGILVPSGLKLVAADGQGLVQH